MAFEGAESVASETERAAWLTFVIVVGGQHRCGPSNTIHFFDLEF